MRILCSLCLAVCFAVSSCNINDARKPPSILIGPKRTEVFGPNGIVVLLCKAEGTPAVTYVWKKNGVDLNLNLPNIKRDTADGSIQINPATKADEGVYQCFASNQYGTALSSNTTHVQLAYLDTNRLHGVDTVEVQEGQPFVIKGARRKSFPTPTYYWEIASSSDDTSPTKLQPSKRMQIACNGDLYFAYAVKSDELQGKFYRDTAYNPILANNVGGRVTKVIVITGNGSLPDFAPNITYTSMSQDVAVVGGNVILKCFFSGNPLADIKWVGPKNTLTPARHALSLFNSELTVSSISESDEGNYKCTGSNKLGSYEQSLYVRVEAKPKFTNESHGPRNVNATEGDTVTFNCRASAKPEASVDWLHDGKPINVNDAPKRFVFSSDKKSLTIRDVCRDCVDRESRTDLMVIQCNASNVHGYAFASGYLNVLRKTAILSLPGSTVQFVDLTKDNHFPFDCRATSDPSTPPTVRWHRIGPHGQESVHNEPPYVYVMNGNLTINIDRNCSAACDKYLEEYRCVADNGYTQDVAIVTFNVTGKPPVDPSPNGLIWIVVGAAIIVCLLLLLLLCCIVFQSRKGDEYDVDEKERKSGRNPEKEIKDSGFQDYYPRDYEKSKSSAESIGSANLFKGAGVDVVVSNYYDDDYEGDFAEDGSFVGKYSVGVV